MSSPNCISGTCLKFNEVGYVSIADDTEFNFGASASFSFWTNGVAGAALEKYMITQYGNAGNLGYYIGKSSTGPGAIIFVAYHDGDGDPYRVTVTSSFRLDGNWHHIGITWNAGTTLIYIDGGLSPTTTSGTATTIFDSTVPICIGGINSWSSYTGAIDEVRIFNATIPTFQIQQMYYVGLNKLFAKNQINQMDYQQRLAELSNNYAKE
jgi:hypothetical protein